MDRDTIIRLAREAGLEILSIDGEDEVGCGDGYHIQTDLIERFAALVAALTNVTPAQIIHSDAAAHEFDAIQLLRLCHTYLRGAEIRLPGGCRPLDRDKLAREINLYLNDLHTNTTESQGQAHDQDQRDHASATDQAPA